MRPRLLDLFCGAGGAAMGYHRAGFDVVGVDIKPQPHYPFEFHQADALVVLDGIVDGSWGESFDVIHASPPCQRFSIATKVHHGRQAMHPDLVAPIRERFQASGISWVIENVRGAPLRSPLLLCGTMFDLRVFRHRCFESSDLLFAPEVHRVHDGSTGAHRGYSTARSGRNGYICVAGHNFEREAAKLAMGIDWMAARWELAEAIPPAYTEFIGSQLLVALGHATPTREAVDSMLGVGL